EYEQGALPAAVHIPRGNLESQIEGRVPVRETPIVVYCAGGTRSAFAAKTLGDLGYTDVVSMAGGFNRWKDEGRAWRTPDVLTPVRRGAHNILDVIDGYAVIVDGPDTSPVRYLVNAASLVKRIPVVHGSIFRFEGQATVFKPYDGPCYRCMIPEPPPAELAPS